MALVGAKLAEALHANDEVCYVALTGADGLIGTLPEHVPTTVLPFRGFGFATDGAALNACIAQFQPDRVIVVGPPLLAYPLLRQLRGSNIEVPVIFYASLEAEVTDPSIFEIFDLCDGVATYSRSAAGSLKACAAKHERTVPEIRDVGHGIASDGAFKPLSEIERCRARKRHRVEHSLPRDAFIVFNGNRPYQRKRLDLTIRGFAKFLRSTRATAFLWLRPVRASAEELANMRDIICDEHIEDNIVLDRSHSLSREELNALYNALDVGINTAMGEGFGLVSFEHALTGAPQLVPDHTGFREHWSEAASLLPTAERVYFFSEYGDMHVTTAEATATALTASFEDLNLRRSLGEAARERAGSPHFQWSSVAERFDTFSFA